MSENEYEDYLVDVRERVVNSKNLSCKVYTTIPRGHESMPHVAAYVDRLDGALLDISKAVAFVRDGGDLDAEIIDALDGLLLVIENVAGEYEDFLEED